MIHAVGRIGLVSDLLRRGISPNYTEDGILVVNQKCIRREGVLDLQYSRRHDEAHREIPEDLLIRPGDILINSTGTGTLGRSCIVREVEMPMTWDSHVTLVRPRQQKVNHSYLGWVIGSEEQRLIELSVGSTNQIELSRGTVFNLEINLPPLETQRRIADYLDRETAEIDAAVADLDKYVELLEKRKLSRIESALSGVNYRMCPVGILADVTLGKMVSTAPPQSGGVERPYLRAAHVQPGGRLDFTPAEKKMWFSEKELERLNLLAGDVVVVEGGAGFGRSAYLESDLEEWGFQNSINRVRVDPFRADGRFVQLMLNRALLNGSIGIAVDTATLPHFTAEKLARFRIPVCEINKQEELSREIHQDMWTTDSLIEEATTLRDLLLKRRSVLITEVVTGRKQV